MHVRLSVKVTGEHIDEVEAAAHKEARKFFGATPYKITDIWAEKLSTLSNDKTTMWVADVDAVRDEEAIRGRD